MTEIKHIGGLELDEDLPHQRREWTVQRVGWVVMALVVLAALAGLLGHGPLSQATARSDDGTVSVEYDRFERLQSPGRYAVLLAPAVVPGERVELRFGPEWVKRAEIERVDPQPVEVRAEGAAMVYTFATTPGQPVRVQVQFRTQAFGSLPVTIDVAGRRLDFRQFIYP